MSFARDVSRIVAYALGAAPALALVLGFVHPPAGTLFLASLGGSAVFLFGLPRVPAAQPRALFGGHVGGATVGVLCYRLFGEGLWVYLLALVLTLLVMLATRTVHPPAGANPLIMVHAHAGLSAVWQPVFVGVAVLFLVAIAWSRMVPGVVRYPLNWLEKSPPTFS